MEHVVFYPSAEGGPAFRRVNSLDEAVSFVEHLRNSENITDFTVHSLTAVPLSFRAYYHVEMPAEDVAASAATDAAAGVETPADAPVVEPVAADELPDKAVEAEAQDAAVAEAAPVPVVDAEPDAPEVPAQAAAPEAVTADEVTLAPVEAADEDRSEEWVAEAAVVEPAIEAAAAAPVEGADGPFAEAPPVTPQGTEDVVPLPTGKRSMGFFAR